MNRPNETRSGSKGANAPPAGAVRRAVAACAVIGLASLVAYVTRYVDSPTGIVTWSGAFVTDEGFHSKWAQNGARFGSYGDPYDFSFAPAGFLHNIAAFLVFRAFGASFEVLRLYAGFLAAFGLLLYWGLLGNAPKGFSRWQAILLLVVTVNYPAYARVLFIEPLGTVFCLASLALAVRPKAGALACTLSVALAFCAFLTKLHFLDVVCSVGVLWVLRLTLWRESGVDDARRVRIAFLCSSAIMLLVVGGLLWLFQERIGEFVSTTRTQFLGRDATPFALRLLSSEWQAFANLPKNTHHAAFFASLVAAAVALVGRRQWRKLAPRTKLQNLSGWIVVRVSGLRDLKLDVAMALWLVLGLLLRGASSYQPPRYFFPLLFPLSYFAVRLLSQLPARYRNATFVAILLVHGYVQSPLYYRWLYRKDIASQYSNHVSFAREIESTARSGPVVVLGNDAAAYALFGKRIRPIEAEYLPGRYTLCDRIGYWRPAFYIGTGADDAFLSQLKQCPGVGAIDEVKRERVFYGAWGDRILYAISEPK